MAARTRYRFISGGDTEALEKRALEIRQQFSGRGCFTDFVVRRLPGTSLVVVVLDDPCEELVEAFRSENWKYGGSV